MADKAKKPKLNLRFYKEVFLSSLAVLSIFFVVLELIFNLDSETKKLLLRFDILVALIFLADFMIALLNAQNKKKYIMKNWYLLLASIPIVDSWAEMLRGLRLFELVRLVRAGEHLNFAIHTKKAR